MEAIRVFNGEGGTLPAGVFSTREGAESWIAMHQPSGCLTWDPLDQPLYDWAIAKGDFKLKHPSHDSSEFIQRFRSAYPMHFHYENGRDCEEGQGDEPEDDA